MTTDEPTVLTERADRGPRGTVVELHVSSGGRELAITAYADDGLRGDTVAYAASHLKQLLASQPDIPTTTADTDTDDAVADPRVEADRPTDDDAADEAEDGEPDVDDGSGTKYGALLADGRGGDR